MSEHTTQQVFGFLAPELSGVDADLRDYHLAKVSGMLRADVFGDDYQEAVVRLAAHRITMDRRKGGGGRLVAQSDHGVSDTYANDLAPTSSALSAYYRQTNHGLAYLAILGRATGRAT